MWLSCSIKNVALKAGSPCHRWAQWLVQRPRFVWELSSTNRPSRHLTLMDPTYAVITRPTGCQLWGGCALVFGEMQPKEAGLAALTSCDHLKRAKKKRGKCSLTPDCEARKQPGNKGLFLWVRYMKSAGSGSLVDRGLHRQKRICKLSERFVLPSYHSLLEKLIIQETSTCHLSVTNLRACNMDRSKTMVWFLISTDIRGGRMSILFAMYIGQPQPGFTITGWQNNVLFSSLQSNKD